jgi:hypothetical protein
LSAQHFRQVLKVNRPLELWLRVLRERQLLADDYTRADVDSVGA